MQQKNKQNKTGNDLNEGFLKATFSMLNGLFSCLQQLKINIT